MSAPAPPAGRQFLAVLAIESRKRLLSRRAIPLYLLALVPVVLFGGHWALVALTGQGSSLAGDISIFAVLFRVLILRLAVFFGCVVVFTGLVRGEILDRSLHYYLMTPTPRSIVVAGKFASGLLATSLLFGASTAASWALLHAPHGRDALASRLASWGGLSELAAYVGVTVLGCLGYGAVFLACGLRFRTPVGPAIAILVWESINIFLPETLKKISVVHYLESLCPVPLPQGQHGPIQILATPSSPWIAIPGILLLAALLLAYSVSRLRRLDLLYGSDSLSS